MGHLVNAKSTRVGWVIGWCDDWFVRNRYYCHFLHNCLKIRYYLAFTFFDRSFEKRMKCFWSHFEIKQRLRVLNVYTYFYDAGYELFFRGCFEYWQDYLEEHPTRTGYRVFFRIRARALEWHIFLLFIFMRMLGGRFFTSVQTDGKNELVLENGVIRKKRRVFGYNPVEAATFCRIHDWRYNKKIDIRGLARLYISKSDKYGNSFNDKKYRFFDFLSINYGFKKKKLEYERPSTSDVLVLDKSVLKFLKFYKSNWGKLINIFDEDFIKNKNQISNIFKRWRFWLRRINLNYRKFLFGNFLRKWCYINKFRFGGKNVFKKKHIETIERRQTYADDFRIRKLSVKSRYGLFASFYKKNNFYWRKKWDFNYPDMELSVLCANNVTSSWRFLNKKRKWLKEEVSFKFLIWCILHNNILGLRLYGKYILKRRSRRWFYSYIFFCLCSLLSSKNNEKTNWVHDRYRYLFKESVLQGRYYQLFNAYNTLFQFFFYKNTGISGDNIKMGHFIITNDEVSAKFLSRFLMKKIEQNVRPRHVINPLRREFSSLISQGLIENHLDDVDNNTILYRKLKYSKQQLWRLFLFWIFNAYICYKLKYFKYYNTWFTLDNWVVYFWFNNKMKNNSLGLNLSRKFYRGNSAFICLFYNNISEIYYGFKNMYMFPYKGSFNNMSFMDLNYIKTKFIGVFNFIYLDFFISKFSLIFTSSKLVNFLEYFHWSNGNVSHVFKYNYYIFNYELYWLQNNSINSIKERQLKLVKNDLFYGLKIKFTGRFSRKQRAGFYSYVVGSVPLNTLKAFIDYDYSVAVVRNSAVSVKVWLNKSTNNSMGIIAY